MIISFLQLKSVKLLEFFDTICNSSISVSYSQLIQFSLQKAHDSIRKALAKATTVSPLRLSDLHVSILYLNYPDIYH